MGVWSLGFRVCGLRFRVEGFGFGSTSPSRSPNEALPVLFLFSSFEFGVKGLGFKAQGSELRI